jgi:hypothetical protein
LVLVSMVTFPVGTEAMAKKKANKPQDETSASQTKAEAPKGRRKKEAPPEDVPVAAETAAKGGAAKDASPKKAAASVGGGAKKGAAPVKLNDKQRELLGKVKEAGESGYAIGQKIEQRTINALQERKLIKRGAKNKETGNYHYLLTKLGEKNLTPPAEATA